ncbi:hypothetical protein AVEN_179883-1, partial [Araneus ventricosus]
RANSLKDEEELSSFSCQDDSQKLLKCFLPTVYWLILLLELYRVIQSNAPITNGYNCLANNVRKKQNWSEYRSKFQVLFVQGTLTLSDIPGHTDVIRAIIHFMIDPVKLDSSHSFSLDSRRDCFTG